LGDWYKEYFVKETISYIRNTTYIDADEINHNWINLKNGLLNPLTKEFKQHTPEIFTLMQLPIEYNPEATCALWEETLHNKTKLAADDKYGKDWKYNLTQEMFGYCFIPDNRFELAFLLYGNHRTMKSTTLYVLGKLLGEKNLQAMSLQYLSEDKHGAAFLYGCPANICADLSSKELRNPAMFMKITGQDRITCGKKYEQEITFLPTTKLFFSCNVVPATWNKTSAFYRRWAMLEYNIQTPEKEVKPEMREELVKEMSGILNWALIGLDKLIKNNKTSYPLSVEETQDLYERNSDSINSFVFTQIDCEDDEGNIKKRDIYKAYRTYCKENNLNIENQIIFGRRFLDITGCGTKRMGTIPAYSGVSFKDTTPIQSKLSLDSKEEELDFESCGVLENE
jgi:putative DNA primase/helicase